MSAIDVNLELLEKAIAEYSRELDWMLRLRIAIKAGDEEQRMKILHEAGMRDPELWPKAKS